MQVRPNSVRQMMSRLRRLACVAMLIGELVTWIALRTDQFIVPWAGLIFVPLRAARPFMRLQVEFIAYASYFVGMLAAIVLWAVAVPVAVLASIAWVAIVVGRPMEISERPLLLAASSLTATFGLLILLGLWGIQGVENPPPFRLECLVYPSTLMLGAIPIWPSSRRPNPRLQRPALARRR